MLLISSAPDSPTQPHTFKLNPSVVFQTPLSHRKCPEEHGPCQRAALLESVWHCGSDARCQPWHVHNSVKLNTWALVPDLMGPALIKDRIYFLKCRAARSVSRWLYIFWLAAPKESIWPPLYPQKSGCCKYKPDFISEDHTFELLPLRQRSRTGVFSSNRIYSKRRPFCSAKSNISVLPGRRCEGKVLRSCFVMYRLSTCIFQVNHSQPGKFHLY